MLETIFITLIIIFIYHFGLYFCLKKINTFLKCNLNKSEIIKYTLRLSVISGIFMLSFFVVSLNINTSNSFEYLFYTICKPLVLYFFIEKYISIKTNWIISFLFIVMFLKILDILFLYIVDLLLKIISF